jgi:hydrogenase small subunit
MSGTKTFYWLQCGGCSGDTLSILNLSNPSLPSLLQSLQIEVLFWPSLTSHTPHEQAELLAELRSGQRPLDFFCVEGNVVQGPDGTGMMDTFRGEPKRDIVRDLAQQAEYVIAVGTCAAYGGFGVDDDMDGVGLQFKRWERGGFLGAEFRSRAGVPVINLGGCPVHSDVLGDVLTLICAGAPLELTDTQQPADWYGMTVHQGCTRNEYHEYRVEESDFGEFGCMFFHMGCKGPVTFSACNKTLWNGRNSKTRAGVPCFGCTRPDFPQEGPFFETPQIADTPIELPAGVERYKYLAYKGMAAVAAPERIKSRQNRI